MKKFCSLLVLVFFTFSGLLAQQPSAGGFGGIYPADIPSEKQMSESQLKTISKTIEANITTLKARGVIKENRGAADTVKFGWPLRQSAGFNDPGYYGISNYVDQDPVKDKIKEYNCGSRTYDGHRGTDIFTYPFFWAKQDQNAVEVIAGADGVIVAKYDNNPDTSCANCDPNQPNCQWNAIYVRSNIDGTIAWYGHLKKNSLTSKIIGAPVSRGEYLGVVGSSGNSTGPHLHFEVWLNSNYNFLVDPWEGVCNQDGNSPFWESQQPYYNPGIIKLSTSESVPQFSQCYQGGNSEKPAFKNSYYLNETVYLEAFVRDNIPGKKYAIKILRPNGLTKYSWNLDAFNSFYAAAWFYYYYPAATTFNEVGTWKWVVTYEGKTEEHPFTILAPLPLTLLSFTGEKVGKIARLNWNTTNEENVEKFVAERSRDGNIFESVGIVNAKGSGRGSITNEYNLNDAFPQSGDNFYRLKMMDRDGKSSLSAVVKLNMPIAPGNLVLISNPADKELRFVCNDDIKMAGVKIIDQFGRTMVLKNLSILRNQQSVINVSNLAAGSYHLVIYADKTLLTRSFIKQ